VTAAAAGLAAAGMSEAEEPVVEAESVVYEPVVEPESMTAVPAFTAEEVVEEAAAPVQEMEEAAVKAGEEISEDLLTGNVDDSDPQEMAKFKYALEYVEGIGPAFGEKLKAIGLLTCLDLLKAGASRKGREEIVAQSGISAKLILEWVNHVDLYRIKGVGSEYADLLEAAGVDTVVELAQRNPGNLFDRMTEVNLEKALVRKPPTASQVEEWVAQAKGLPRVVTY
jgi:predicted flap endonuclease-1-like 5' DNA nuclease